MKKVPDLGIRSAVLYPGRCPARARRLHSAQGRASTVSSSGALPFTGGDGSGTDRGTVLLGQRDANQPTDTSTGRITTSGRNAYAMSAAREKTNTDQLEQLNNTLVNTGFPPGRR